MIWAKTKESNRLHWTKIGVAHLISYQKHNTNQMKLNRLSMLPRSCRTDTASSIRTVSTIFLLSTIYKHGIIKRKVNGFSRPPVLVKMLQLFQQSNLSNMLHVSRNSVRIKSLSILQKVTLLFHHKVSRYEKTTPKWRLSPNSFNYSQKSIFFHFSQFT